MFYLVQQIIKWYKFFKMAICQKSERFSQSHLAACSWGGEYTGPQNHFLMSFHSLPLQSAPWPALGCGWWNGEYHTTQGWTLQRIYQVGKCGRTSGFLNIKWAAILSIQTLPLFISLTVRKLFRTSLVPLFSMYLVSCLAWSKGTPWISTLTKGSTIESSLILTLGSCWPLIT